LVPRLACVEICDTRCIAARLVSTRNEPVHDRVKYNRKHDRNGRRDLPYGPNRHSTDDHDYLGTRRDHLGGEAGQQLISASRKPCLDLNVLPLNITQPGEFIAEVGKNRAVAAGRQDDANATRWPRDLLTYRNRWV
jgi:hypothetical protein